MHADQPRAAMLWKKIAPDAVNKTMRLVADCPELKSSMQKLPRNKPWEVIPLMVGGPQKRRRSNKLFGRTTAHAISRAFLRQQKRLHSTREKIAYSEQQAMKNVEGKL